MAHWAVVVPAELWATERLFQHDTLTLPGGGPAGGDDVVLIAGDEPRAVALGRVADTAGDAMLVAYTRRAFDAGVPAGTLPLADAVTPLSDANFALVADKLGGGPPPRAWLVSLDLPIEAGSRAEAVRQFWSYVLELGPTELPAFVSPYGDELAMQAFVLGEEANLDPEEDED